MLAAQLRFEFDEKLGDLGRREYRSMTSANSATSAAKKAKVEV
jgi:hypothetical protein